mgnify:FL=1
MAAAGRLVDRYPNSVEAQTVLPRMETLESNARIALARDKRDRIRGLIERKRYGEAIRLGRELIRELPETRAAAELGQQIPRLEDLARGRC